MNGKLKRKPVPWMLKEHERAVMTTALFNVGLLPIEDPYHDTKRMLDQLPPDEARKLKRKFRKVWRRFAKEEARALTSNAPKPVKQARIDSLMTSRYGKGKKNPSRSDRAERKRLVQEGVYGGLVRPIIEQFEKAGRGKPDGS